MFDDQKPPLKVLVAPLDWGLGHATRCIPLIQKLTQARCHVYVAGNPTAIRLIGQEVPGVEFLPLEGYQVHYSSKRAMAWKILKQIPKILRAIRRERQWLKNTIALHGISLVFSDNRFGLQHPAATCIFITHQLHIKAPAHWMEKVLQKINYRFINRFDACWVPDYSEVPNIAGTLSHPAQLPAIPVRYIGPLSRLKAPAVPAPMQYKWLFLVSGPEPQRSILEQKILDLLSILEQPALLVRGLPLEVEQLAVPAHCKAVNHLPAKDLEKVFAQSEYIISRSGYTTVMEILATGKKSILIPTPGQTEQEYLATRLMEQAWCYSMRQEDALLPHLQKAQSFDYQLPQFPAHTLQVAVDSLLSK